MSATVHAAPDVDAARLGEYLRQQLGGWRGPLRLQQFPVGQSNPTYRVFDADGQSCVLRKKPPGTLLPSAHAVEREFRVISALHGVGFPVARPLLLCEDAAVIGTAFYVMDFVDGRVLWDQAMPEQSKAERGALWDELNRVLARLHSIDYKAIGLADYGRSGNYLTRQIGRWSKQYRATEAEPIAAMDRLIEWLPQNIPAGDETTIIHGDYRLDNVIFHASEARILAVLDWELSTLGDPLSDFAYHATSWHMPISIFPTIAGLDHAALGFPSEQSYVQTYCQRMGRAMIERPVWDYYMAFNLFRIAAIAHGVGARARGGNASNPAGLEVGRKAGPIAEVAWSLVDKIAQHRSWD